MNTKEAAALMSADRRTTRTGQSHAVIKIGNKYKVIPVSNSVDTTILTVCKAVGARFITRTVVWS